MQPLRSTNHHALKLVGCTPPKAGALYTVQDSEVRARWVGCGSFSPRSGDVPIPWLIPCRFVLPVGILVLERFGAVPNSFFILFGLAAIRRKNIHRSTGDEVYGSKPFPPFSGSNCSDRSETFARPMVKRHYIEKPGGKSDMSRASCRICSLAALCLKNSSTSVSLDRGIAT